MTIKYTDFNLSNVDAGCYCTIPYSFLYTMLDMIFVAHDCSIFLPKIVIALYRPW